MRQLLLSGSTGEISVQDVPVPRRDPASLLVATQFSLISPGTERSVVELGRASLLAKARARPDLVRKVVEAGRSEGIGPTYAKVRGRLEQPNAVGYSLSGQVLESCEGGPAGPGELVACAGAGFASHAEVAAVPKNLCARVPDGVALEDAAYATISAIALHGVRLCRPELGGVAAVVGLGLVGQLALQLLRAAGCVALGVDPEPGRVEAARKEGFFATTEAVDLDEECRRLTDQRGADSVLVAAASKSAGPLETAVTVARERAVISIVGDVPVRAARRSLFEKELRLVVSRSYGPGRYDPNYELHGHDYPAAYVRWTEGRNLAEVLRLMATGQLRPSRLTTHTFDIDEGARAYALLDSDEPSLGILLRYPEHTDGGGRSVRLEPRRRHRLRAIGRARLSIGVIGAGTFARTVLIPGLSGHADIVAVAAATGPSARGSAERFGATLATTDAAEVLQSDEVDAVVIATRHDTHARFAAEALRAGKHVFVEKPLALDAEGLEEVKLAATRSEGVLFVGFNRRFAPMARRLREALGDRGPLLISYRVNAGRLPRTHWLHDPEIGGGRIVGEACHFVDFASFLANSAPAQAKAVAVSGGSEYPEDNVCATISLADGSVAHIAYSAFGDPSLPKERVEVLGETGAGVLDDFRELRLYRHGREETARMRRDKGHVAELKAFSQACRNGVQPWPVEEMAAVTHATFEIRDRLHGRGPDAS
jgi:predicted dehydrogenase/threonine dehydrogenase-like Zn-dependent dehydrogenase